MNTLRAISVIHEAIGFAQREYNRCQSQGLAQHIRYLEVVCEDIRLYHVERWKTMSQEERDKAHKDAEAGWPLEERTGR